MLLGLHTYSFHLHGMGQDWGGYELSWPRVMDIYSLMDETGTLGLDIQLLCEKCNREKSNRI